MHCILHCSVQDDFAITYHFSVMANMVMHTSFVVLKNT